MDVWLPLQLAAAAPGREREKMAKDKVLLDHLRELAAEADARAADAAAPPAAAARARGAAATLRAALAQRDVWARDAALAEFVAAAKPFGEVRVMVALEVPNRDGEFEPPPPRAAANAARVRARFARHGGADGADGADDVDGAERAPAGGARAAARVARCDEERERVLQELLDAPVGGCLLYTSPSPRDRG